MTNRYCFVLDYDGKPLSPTKENKGWFLIRKDRATLEKKYPMTIKLNKIIEDRDLDKSKIHVGIDDGSKHVGLALVQEGQKRNKVVFKGTIELRQDVKYKMSTRRAYRQHRRYNKRYRPNRFNNRVGSENFLVPTIKQKRQTIVRVISEVKKHIRINKIHLEDVKFKTNVFNSSRLNILERDNYSCKLCGDLKRKKEIHHIIPIKSGGGSTENNLITLCTTCHNKVTGKEHLYINKFHSMIERKHTDYNKHMMHVMSGKNYLQRRLQQISTVYLTNGLETSYNRNLWEVNKTHSNDAIVITRLKPNKGTKIGEYIITPQRRKRENIYDTVLNFRHRDLVKYTPKNKKSSKGYIIGIRKKRKALQVRVDKSTRLDGISAKSCTLLWRFTNIVWKEGE